MGADGQPVRLPRQLGRVLRVQDLPGGLQGQERSAGRPALAEGLRGDVWRLAAAGRRVGRRRSPPTTCRRPATTASTPCASRAARPTRSRKTETGIVLIDESSCRNCHACELACPDGAIRFNPVRNTTTKCDFCVDLLDLGRPPACVAGCPNRALDYGDLWRAGGGPTHPAWPDIFPLPSGAATLPAVVIHPGMPRPCRRARPRWPTARSSEKGSTSSAVSNPRAPSPPSPC